MAGRTYPAIKLTTAELEKLQKIRARVDMIRKSYVPGCKEWPVIMDENDKALAKFRAALMAKGLPEWYIQRTIHNAELSILEVVKNKHAQKAAGLKFE
jgi:hypothetical protein